MWNEGRWVGICEEDVLLQPLPALIRGEIYHFNAVLSGQCEFLVRQG